MRLPSADGPRLSVAEVALYERDVRLRLPFRFGVVTLTEAPQAFARVRLRLGDGAEGWGMAAEVLAPKWFDKDPQLSDEHNCDQLRAALMEAAGYGGPIEVEIFSANNWWKRDPHEVVRVCKERFETAV